jgi:hypothetical protein
LKPTRAVAKIYDIIAIGSLSIPHRSFGLVHLLNSLTVSCSVACSQSFFASMASHIHPSRLKKVTLSSYTLDNHSITVFPFLPIDALQDYISKSKFGFFSLDPSYNGSCFPSKLFAYVSNDCPVIFDGLPDSIDNIISRNSLGLAEDFSNLSPDQIRFFYNYLDVNYAFFRESVKKYSNLIALSRKAPLDELLA